MPAALTKILCAEDDPDIQAIIRMSLEFVGGYTVRLVDNGREALEHLPDFAPDLLLLDVMMPEMDGPATLNALRARPELAGIPVVFLTAKTQQSEVEQYLALGIAEVIQKPFDPLTLPEQVRAIWERCYA
ncbi:MAG: response regulator [Rhodothermales bacterium]